MDNPTVKEVGSLTMARYNGLEIIPATLNSLKNLNLSRGQICLLLFGGMLCSTATAFYYISKKKDPGTTYTVGATLDQNKKTKANIEDVTVTQNGEQSGGSNTVGLKAKVTDDAELKIKNINVTV